MAHTLRLMMPSLTRLLKKENEADENLMTSWHHLVTCYYLHEDYESDNRDMNDFECCWLESNFEARPVYWCSCNS